MAATSRAFVDAKRLASLAGSGAPNGDLASCTSSRSCSFCDRKFVKPDHLRRHIRSHTKEKPFACDTCGKRYVRADTLLRHYSVHRQVPGKGCIIAGSSPDPTSLRTNSPSNATQRTSGQWCSRQNDVLKIPSEHLHFHSPTAAAGHGCGTDARSTNGPELDNVPNREPVIQESMTTSTPSIELDALTNQNYSINNRPDPFMMQVADSEPEFGVDLSISSDLGQQGIADFDFGQIDWQLLGSIPLDNSESYGRPPPTSVDAGNSISQSVEKAFNTASPAVTVEHLWYTRFETGNTSRTKSSDNQRSGTTSPGNEGSPRTEINEGYRQSLSGRLRPKPSEEPLPSGDFLTLCVQLYFSRANPILPILHAPTFRPTTENGGLLLSICSIGCLFLGTSEAAHYGAVLFERLLKAMMLSWVSIQAHQSQETVPMVQLALLGQTFGILSGDPGHLAIVSAFHGTVISWARRVELLKVESDTLDLSSISDNRLKDAWHEWARKEEMRRTALAIYVHDAEISALFNHEPFLRHTGNCILLASQSDVFNATNVQTWANLLKNSNSDTTLCNHEGAVRPPLLATHIGTASCCQSVFTSYAVLEGIGASIRENRIREQHDFASQQGHELDLISWYQTYGDNVKSEGDPLFLIALWHFICMSNYVDIHCLELAVGKQGPADALSHARHVHEWAHSIDARRCLMHATLLQKTFDDKLMRQVVAMHVPRCLFSATLVVATYLTYVTEHPPAPTLEDFREIRLLGINLAQCWQDVLGFRNRSRSAIKASTLHALADTLRQISYWGISQKFSNILSPLIHKGTDMSIIQR